MIYKKYIYIFIYIYIYILSFVYISSWALVYFLLHLLQVGVFVAPFSTAMEIMHVLGCHSGSTRIKHHDALCDIIFHCLQANNSGTRREQCCCSDDSSCRCSKRAKPGD